MAGSASSQSRNPDNRSPLPLNFSARVNPIAFSRVNLVRDVRRWLLCSGTRAKVISTPLPKVPIPRCNRRFSLATAFFFVKSLKGGVIERPLVVVVDDDESVRRSLPGLLGEFGFRSRVFPSAEEFLASDAVSRTDCLVLDVGMPGMTGLDLQQELAVRGDKVAIVFITGTRDEMVHRRALAQGAVGFLSKPFSDTALLSAINKALGLD
jgi:CheY-like chemotaxis protein